MERDKERESVREEQDIADDPVLMGAITLLLVMLFILNKMNMEVCTC
jgi:hypothetical protein